jgi:hypothetical protein
VAAKSGAPAHAIASKSSRAIFCAAPSSKMCKSIVVFLYTPPLDSEANPVEKR